VALPRTIGALAQVEAQDEDNCRSSLIPFLIRQGSLAQVTNANVGIPPGLLPDLSVAELLEPLYQKLPVALPKDHRALLASSEFLGLVTQAYTDQGDVLFMLERTERRLREAQAAIRAELGEPAQEANP